VNYDAGSADTMRDEHGLAVKFYTEEGTYVLTTLNVPVFPIRDPVLFHGLSHSRTRNAATHLFDKNMYWDFVALRPETTHEILRLFSDSGFPDGYRHMNTFAINAFKLVNANGDVTYTKFHFITEQGLRNMSPENATLLAGMDPDYATRDLYNAIGIGNFPTWNLCFQRMSQQQADALKWNPFDPTKIWPESEFPLAPIGKLILDRNPVDHFSEVEQSAFCPLNLVPGIELSSDKILNARSFAYWDAQRYRLGTNFAQLPINKPIGKVNSYVRNGAAVQFSGNGGPSYFPNSFRCPEVSSAGKQTTFPLCGVVDRYETKDEDNYSQAREYLKGLSSEESERLVNNIVASLSKTAKFIQKNVLVNCFQKTSAKFASKVSKKLSKI